VCKVLFVAMRVKPECMTAVSFLTGRVQDPGEDDQKKLYRLLGYLYETRGTGIVLRIGDEMMVSSYIDAACGVHQESGKSHTGSFVTIGEGGSIYVSSGKQKVLTMSSTEAGLIATSDKAGNGISLNHFLREQGHAMGPVTRITQARSLSSSEEGQLRRSEHPRILADSADRRRCGHDSAPTDGGHVRKHIGQAGARSTVPEGAKGIEELELRCLILD
jgi:hypothetical protein